MCKPFTRPQSSRLDLQAGVTRAGKGNLCKSRLLGDSVGRAVHTLVRWAQPRARGHVSHSSAPREQRDMAGRGWAVTQATAAEASSRSPPVCWLPLCKGSGLPLRAQPRESTPPQNPSAVPLKTSTNTAAALIEHLLCTSLGLSSSLVCLTPTPSRTAVIPTFRRRRGLRRVQWLALGCQQL